MDILKIWIKKISYHGPWGLIYGLLQIKLASFASSSFWTLFATQILCRFVLTSFFGHFFQVKVYAVSF